MNSNNENDFVSSMEIAKELGSRNEHVKRKVKMLSQRGLIGFYEQARIHSGTKPYIVFKLSPKDTKTLYATWQHKRTKGEMSAATINIPANNNEQEKLDFVIDEKTKTAKPANQHKAINIPFTVEGYSNLVAAAAKAERLPTTFIKRAIQKAIDEELAGKVRAPRTKRAPEKAPVKVGFFKSLLSRI